MRRRINERVFGRGGFGGKETVNMALGTEGERGQGRQYLGQ